MTTEIAVANRLGVALATDSAVTISGLGVRKVFNSGDKLFELSCHHPVGIMINGNLDFLSVPWELIIKGFRDGPGVAPRTSIQEWVSAFVQWVEQHAAVTPAAVKQWLRTYIAEELQSIRRAAIDGFSAWFDSQQSEPSEPAKVLIQLLRDEIAARVHHNESIGANTIFSDVSIGLIKDEIGPILPEECVKEFQPDGLDEELQRELLHLISTKLLTEHWTDFSTGIVIAGYAGDNMFPALYSLTVDGFVAGKLRYAIDRRVKVSREPSEDGLTSHVLGTAISFAQTDVIERLLRGTDRRFVNETVRYFDQAISAIFRGLVDAGDLKLSDADGNPVDPDQFGKDLAGAVSGNYQRKSVDRICAILETEFNQTIAVMPKQELIELAEALVNITAIERKASSDQETVGGPIDVALITRAEGFVWIKRKHHFSASLNPRYVQRVSALMGRQEGAGDHAA